MLVTIWLAVASAAQPPLGATAVVVTRRTQVSAGDAKELARLVGEALKKEDIDLAFDPDAAAKRLASVGVRNTASCAGRRECTHEFARQLNVLALVAVTASQLGNERALGVELYSVRDEKVLLKDSILFPARSMPTADLLQGFARKVRPLLKGEEEPPVVVVKDPPVDVPPVVDPPKLTPDPKVQKTPPGLVVKPPPPKSHAAGFVTGGVAVVAAASAAAFAVLAVNAQTELHRTETLSDGRRVSPHTQGQAQALTQKSNTFFTVAAASAGAAAALGVTAVLVW